MYFGVNCIRDIIYVYQHFKMNPTPPPNTSPRVQNTGSFWKPKMGLVIAVVIIFVLCFSIFVYQKIFQNNLVVVDQALNPTLDIKKLVLNKGGFLIIDSIDILSARLYISEYIPAGTYKDFSVAYPGTALLFEDVNSLRAFVFEDVNGNQVFDNEKVKSDIFGTPLLSHFVVKRGSAVPLACSNGFNDNFDGNTVNKDLWGSHILNTVVSGYLKQPAINNLTVGTSTILYSKKTFSGDVAADAKITSLDVSDGLNTEFVGTVEFEIFTSTNRVASAKWTKTNTDSFLTLGTNSGEVLATDTNNATPSASIAQKYDVSANKPLSLKIKRVGTVATVSYLDDSGAYKDLVNIPEVPVDPVFVGIETADNSLVPHKITSTIDNISVSCPQ